MAFGFGFNKQKALSAAEKFVQQGKLQNAITEYEKVLKADPKDLTVMNTVGDLYSRLGSADKAVECFKSVGDAYAAQGFTVKAIAMYKKLSKLQSSLESVLRLAELYTQQGLFNDARAQYLHVAEEFLRSGELEQAVRIFQKTLEMDPENVAMRTRLAEVYVRLGKKTEAWQIFAAAAETLRGKGQLEAAEELLQRMLTLDPGNSYALLMQGRTAFDSGNMAGCIACLEKVADLDTHADGLHALLQAYLQTGRLAEAGTIAAKLVSVHNDSGAITSYADALIAAGQFSEALEIYQQNCDRLLAADTGKVLETLHSMIGHVRENTAALETLLDLLKKAGESTHVTEVCELLAHAYVQSEDFEKARDYYLKLTQLEPQNQLHADNYQQVLAKIGAVPASKLITAEEGAVLVEELEATAPFVDQRYDDEVALAVRAALTDAELFISYNMPAKALGPLLSALPQAPRDLRVNQRLAALHTRAGRFGEAAICCRTLESVYHDAGHPDEATRYGELANKYEERAVAAVAAAKPSHAAPAATPAKIVVPEVPVQEAEVAAPAEETSAVEAAAAAEAVPAASGLFFHASAASTAGTVAESGEFDVKPAAAGEEEIDLSQEWDGTASDAPASSIVAPAARVSAVSQRPAPDNVEAVSATIDEIRFYLAQGMAEEAHAALAVLEQQKPGAEKLEAIRAEIAAAAAHSHAPGAEAAEEVSVEEVDVPGMAEEAEGATEVAEVSLPEAVVKPAGEPAVEPTARAGALGELVADLESALPENFVADAVAAPQAHAEMQAHAEAHTEPVKQQPGALGEFVADLEASLGNNFLPQAAAPTKAEALAHPAAMAAAASASAAVIAPFPHPGIPISHPGTPQVAPSGSVDISAGVDLADMFVELKQELEEGGSPADEDPETHYNLGVAFREMGLLDEAIGELQKVCQAVDHGYPFTQIMQTYTWLAQCFLDKGIPEAAIRWYEKALALPTIDQETRTALHYELGSACEISGNKPAALKHFLEVYGSNIDYRDVGERIKALKS